MPIGTTLGLGMGALGAYGSYRGASGAADDLADAIEKQNEIMERNMRMQERARDESMSLLSSPTDRMQSAFDMGDSAVDSMQMEQSRMMPGIRGGFDTLSDTAQGEFLHAEDNPYLQSHIEAAQRPVQQQYEENIRPQLSSQAIQQGAFGGAREGLTQAQAGRDHQQQLGDISTQMSAQNYQQERSNQLSAAQSLPQMAQQTQQIQQAPAQMNLQMGEMDQQRRNQKAQAAQMTPQQQVPSLQQTEAGASMMAPDPVEQGMQGLMGGMQLGGMMGDSIQGAFNLGGSGSMGSAANNGAQTASNTNSSVHPQTNRRGFGSIRDQRIYASQNPGG